jgi:hypothetical protein
LAGGRAAIMARPMTLDILGTRILRVICAGGLVASGPAIAAVIWTHDEPGSILSRPLSFLILWALASVIFGMMHNLAGLEPK